MCAPAVPSVLAPVTRWPLTNAHCRMASTHKIDKKPSFLISDMLAPAPAPAPQLSPKSKKTKTKPRAPSPSVSEPSVASSQDVRDEPPTFVKGEIVTEERPEIGEIKDFLPDMSDPFFNHKGSVLGNQNSSSVVSVL